MAGTVATVVYSSIIVERVVWVLPHHLRHDMYSEAEVEELREALAAARRESDDLRVWRESVLAEHEEQLRRLRR